MKVQMKLMTWKIMMNYKKCVQPRVYDIYITHTFHEISIPE